MITYITDGEYLVTLRDGQEIAREINRAAPVVTAARKMTRLAFLSRFTDAEAIAIDLASIGATVGAATIRRATNKTNAATYIDPQLAETRNGVLAIEAAGLIASGRALIILDTPITDTELFRG
jgi:hypothetical protein